MIGDIMIDIKIEMNIIEIDQVLKDQEKERGNLKEKIIVIMKIIIEIEDIMIIKNLEMILTIIGKIMVILNVM